MQELKKTVSGIETGSVFILETSVGAVAGIDSESGGNIRTVFSDPSVDPLGKVLLYSPFLLLLLTQGYCYYDIDATVAITASGAYVSGVMISTASTTIDATIVV